VSNAELQHALAALLVTGELRHELTSDPDAVGRRFALTEAEVRQLVMIERARLDFTADGIARARVKALRRMFVTTTRMAPAPSLIESALEHFVATDTPRAAADEASRWFAEGWRFVQALAEGRCGPIEPHLVDLARLEWLRAELLYNREADAAARDAAATAALARTASDDCLVDDVVLQLGVHVRLQACACDVLALRAGQRDVPQMPTSLVVSRCAGRAAVAVSRVQKSVFLLLSRLDGDRTLAQLAAEGSEASGGSRDSVDQAVHAARFGLEHQLVVAVPRRRAAALEAQ
jgi:hypothetical protein